MGEFVVVGDGTPGRGSSGRRGGSRTLDGLADVAKVFGHCLEACDGGSDRGTARHPPRRKFPLAALNKKAQTTDGYEYWDDCDTGVVSGKARAGDGAKGSRRVFARERKTRAHLLRRNCPVASTRARVKCARRSSPTVADSHRRGQPTNCRRDSTSRPTFYIEIPTNMCGRLDS